MPENNPFLARAAKFLPNISQPTQQSAEEPAPFDPSSPPPNIGPLTDEERIAIMRQISDSAGSLDDMLSIPERYAEAVRAEEQRRTGSATNYFYQQSNELATQLQEGGYDPERYQEYADELTAPIGEQFYDAANSTSAYLARQGLGSSGINVAAHGELGSNAAALESSARRQALGMARDAERQRLLDSFQTRLGAMGPVLQQYGIDVNAYIAMQRILAEQQMARDARDAQLVGGIGQAIGTGLGYAAGGPAGAAVGSGLWGWDNVSGPDHHYGQ